MARKKAKEQRSGSLQTQEKPDGNTTRRIPDDVKSDLSKLYVNYDQFDAMFRKGTDHPPDYLADALRTQAATYAPTGWFMLEVCDMWASRLGERRVVVYGENCTYKEVPTVAVSPRGLASDMSMVVAVLLADQLPSAG